MSHFALVFGYVGHLYAIKRASEWSHESPTVMTDVWWATMQTWSLATFGRPQYTGRKCPG